MATEVIKRDGSKQPFEAEKIRKGIEAAAREAGVEEGRIAGLVEQASGPVLQWAEGAEEAATSEIAERVLAELEQAAPEAAEAWREHDRRAGKA